MEYEIAVPEGAIYNCAVENDNKLLIINCDLLNRAEFFKVGFTSIDSKSKRIHVTARLENLTCREITDEDFSLTPSPLLYSILVDVIKKSSIRLYS